MKLVEPEGELLDDFSKKVVGGGLVGSTNWPGCVERLAHRPSVKVRHADRPSAWCEPGGGLFANRATVP